MSSEVLPEFQGRAQACGVKPPGPGRPISLSVHLDKTRRRALERREVHILIHGGGTVG
jgi:hypothetical protein